MVNQFLHYINVKGVDTTGIKNKTTDSELLKYIKNNDIIDMVYIQEQMEMKKREELLSKHPYAIWEDKRGVWRTYFPDKEKGRIQRERRSKEALEDLIVDYWKAETDNPKISEIYKEWVEAKYRREEIETQTKNRYDREYKQIFTRFGQNRIKNIEPYDIEDFLLNALHEHNLSAKAFSNVKTLVRGIFRFAKKKGYVDYSISEILSDMEVSKRSFRKSRKANDELVFTEKDYIKLNEYLCQKKLDITDYGILLLFYTGMRPGELSALKSIDIDCKNNLIYVNRTEVRYEDENGKYVYEVRDFPKTEAGIRDVYLPDCAMWIVKEIRKLNPFGDYLFEKKGKRLKSCSFDRRIRTICKNADITEKSLNKIRKTYSSILVDSGASEGLIVSQLGHTNIKTTMDYYYKNRRNASQRIDALNKAFENANLRLVK